MSSAEDDDHDSNHASGSKKRRVQRACDVCRRKKIRCDGGMMPGNRCTNCVTYDFTCTYLEAAKKRGPPKGYVESLENRLEKMEKLLQQMCPDGDFSQELGGHFDKETWMREKGTGSSALPHGIAPMALPPTASGSGAGGAGTGSGGGNETDNGDEDSLESSDDELQTGTLADWIKRLQINPAHPRFFGKSSGVRLIQTAIDLKGEYNGAAVPRDEQLMTVVARRPEYWHPRPWEADLSGSASHKSGTAVHVFPDADLIPVLVDYYFTMLNPYAPLLHRPTFEKSVADGLHTRDAGFGNILLLVCASGARYCSDPRVLLDGASLHSAGWKWFNQVQMVRKSLLAAPCLYDLQMYCLSVMFLQGSSAPQACWTMVGIGIRLAQDIGAHRRKVYNNKLTIHDELWKRAFWVLVSYDRSISCALGRPCAIQDEDFDLDLPACCDDEYWTNPLDPEKAFEQPANKPSYVMFYICMIKLNQILAFALRTIYSINKSKVLLGFVGQQWEQHIVAELDSALNKWIDSVPDHLRWDPDREHDLFFNQSAMLYAAYYHLQIVIHRPFIPSPRKPSPLTFPSLAICTNAARSCSHVLDIQCQRNKYPVPHQTMPAFTAGIVLLLNIWGGKKSGVSTDPAREMVDVYKCMNVLRSLESRWHSAGRLWDVLCELTSVGDLPLPQPGPGPGLKRTRDSDGHMAYMDAQNERVDMRYPRSVAGSKRVNRAATAKEKEKEKKDREGAGSGAAPSSSESNSPHSAMYSPFSTSGAPIPLRTEELGRMPLHPGNAPMMMPMQQQQQPLVSTQPLAQGQDPLASDTNLGMLGMGIGGAGADSPWYTLQPGVNPGLVPGAGPSATSPLDGLGVGAGVGTGSAFAPNFGATPFGPAPTAADLTALGMTDAQALDFVTSMWNPDPLGFGTASGGMFGGGMGGMGAGLGGMGGMGSPFGGLGGFGGLDGLGGGVGAGMMPQQGLMDDDTIAMWSSAPPSFEMDDWGSYVNSVSGLHPPNPPPADDGNGNGVGARRP